MGPSGEGEKKARLCMGKNIYGEVIEAVQSGKTASIVTRFREVRGMVGRDLTKELAPEGEGSELRPTLLRSEDGAIFREPVAGKERLILLGGGHIALALCEFAARTGFAVTVVDDRQEFAAGARFPWAKEVICEDFVRALGRLGIGETDYIAIITRGHRHDTDCLRFLLSGRKPRYTGMIGSRRKIRECFSKLGEEGYRSEQLQEVRTPIGLDIGAVLPVEIAISILAELISCRRKQDKHAVTTDLDVDVVEHLARLNEPSVVITVMKRKGSTPRGEGAKMVVDRHGSTRGSIGGGWAERYALDLVTEMIGTGEYRVVKLDLTGTAEAEGMLCGGTMEVLLEDFRA